MSQELELSFWDHLDELRKILFRIAAAVIGVTVVAFLCKDWLFSIVLAPQHDDFIFYRLINQLAKITSISAMQLEAFRVDLINTQLASQFLTHMSMSFYMGVLLTFPYILYQLFRFVSPALHSHERRYAGRMIAFSSLLFYLGVLLDYFVIFPLSFRFLATYQVSSEVQNMISLSSYIDTLLLLSLLMGIVFELPILSWLFAKLGFLTHKFMRHYRRHAAVIILVIAAIITPTADAFTLLLVFFPIYILYEMSILIVKRTNQETEK